MAGLSPTPPGGEADGRSARGPRERVIRPIVIGVAIHDDRILAIEGFDGAKGERFYRPPGGGIETRSPDRKSQRVAEKAGMTREGVARNAAFTNSGRVDLVVFGLTPGDLSAPADR